MATKAKRREGYFGSVSVNPPSANASVRLLSRLFNWSRLQRATELVSLAPRLRDEVTGSRANPYSG